MASGAPPTRTAGPSCYLRHRRWRRCCRHLRSSLVARRCSTFRLYFEVSSRSLASRARAELMNRGGVAGSVVAAVFRGTSGVVDGPTDGPDGEVVTVMWSPKLCSHQRPTLNAPVRNAATARPQPIKKLTFSLVANAAISRRLRSLGSFLEGVVLSVCISVACLAGVRSTNTRQLRPLLHRSVYWAKSSVEIFSGAHWLRPDLPRPTAFLPSGAGGPSLCSRRRRHHRYRGHLRLRLVASSVEHLQVALGCRLRLGRQERRAFGRNVIFRSS